MISAITTVTSQAIRESGIGRILAGIGPPPSLLRPEHALAYLLELQPAARDVAVIGPGGALLAGAEGAPARAARDLQRAGGGRRAEGSLLALAAGGRAVGASLPDIGALAEFDLRSVLSAIGVTFAP